MDHIQGFDRNQMQMMSFEQLVEAESFVRIIDAFIDALDLSQFDFTYYKLKKEGRPPFHPADLLKLYIYGYKNNIRSCRKLETACKINIEVIWLMKGKTPSFKTIANFRKNNSDAFRQVFRYFIFILKEWKLIDGKHITIDSFKVRAQNSLKNNYNNKKIKRHLEYIDTKIDEYQAELDDEPEPQKKKELIEKIVSKNLRRKQYTDLQERIETEQIDQISTTDPDARAVILHRNIVNVGYNIQAASDSKYKMMIAADTGDVNDTHQLANMTQKSMQNTGSNKCTVLADKGYHTGSQIAATEQLGAKPFISPKANSTAGRSEVFPLEAFKYHPGSDTYKCPNGETLRSNGTIYQRKVKKKGQAPLKFKHYITKACKTCPIKAQCTQREQGRIVQRSEYQSAIERNNKTVKANPEYYRNRQQLIEHQFGTFKRQWGFTHVLTRGKEKVLGEVSILFSTYNLYRTMSVLGFDGIMKRINALKRQNSPLKKNLYPLQQTELMTLPIHIRQQSYSHPQFHYLKAS